MMARRRGYPPPDLPRFPFRENLFAVSEEAIEDSLPMDGRSSFLSPESELTPAQQARIHKLYLALDAQDRDIPETKLRAWAKIYFTGAESYEEPDEVLTRFIEDQVMEHQITYEEEL